MPRRIRVGIGDVLAATRRRSTVGLRKVSRDLSDHQDGIPCDKPDILCGVQHVILHDV